MLTPSDSQAPAHRRAPRSNLRKEQVRVLVENRGSRRTVAENKITYVCRFRRTPETKFRRCSGERDRQS